MTQLTVRYLAVCRRLDHRPLLTSRYTYDSCDVGTLANQTWPNGTSPEATLTTGAQDGPLSYLPGQRLSACTCPGEDHPGPDVSVGRAAPEIDLIEAQVKLSVQHGEVSQSYQVAPFDDHYQSDNSTGKAERYDDDLTEFNSYLGGIYQQAVSGLTLLPDRIYNDQITGGRSKEFGVFSFEYSAHPEEREKGYIHWVADDKPAWTMYADAVGPNPRTEIGRRIISEEPMYMVSPDSPQLQYNATADDLDYQSSRRELIPFNGVWCII
jgi:beta-glucanase (GH16 family)